MKPVDPDRTAVAQDLFTYCTKEKTETWHIVRNHDAKGIVERVICKACGSEHKYKRKTLAAPKKTAATRTAVVRKTTLAENSVSELKNLWFNGIKKWGTKVVSEFTAERTYERGEVFSHPTFGKGVVQVRRESRVDVLFEEGVKTLPSKRGSPQS